MATKKGRYKVINADNTVDIIHLETSADMILDGTSKQVPTKAEIQKWNSVSGGGINIYVSSTNPTTQKAFDILFKLL